LENRQPDEVRYYHPDDGKSVFASDLGSTVPSAYGSWCLEAMDSHGGWIASADDLVRFINAIPFDGNLAAAAESRAVLTPTSARLILAAPQSDDAAKDSYYGLGWTIRPAGDGSYTVWHTGSLPGTATELTRRADGRCFAILINSRSGSGGKNPLNDFTRAIHRALADLDAKSITGLQQ
jgi:N-acyl-D-amino-acid deacylase